jgi:proline racemase
MTYNRLILTVESHTQGEPTRLIVGGVIHVPGDTMRARQQHAARDLDWIRRSLMSEPRGHPDMYGGFIIPPATEDGDLGILYMDNEGFMDMCGHGTIGLCTVVSQLGLVNRTEPRTEIKIDTPVGRVNGFALWENGKVVRAGFWNVPSFCSHLSEKVRVDGFGTVEVGIAYGGNYFGILPAEKVGLDMHMDNMERIREVGLEVKRAINEQVDVRHPDLPEVGGVNIITFYGPPDHPEATYKNVHMFSNGQVDRSPGGTGTSAVLAYFHARGEFQADGEATVEGLAGGLFGGRFVKSWRENGLVKHTPEITGVAHIIGVNQYMLNSDDPMLEGIPRKNL